MFSDHEELRKALEAVGLSTVEEFAIDHGPQLTIVQETSGKIERVFSLARRPSAWFLLGIDGLYCIGREDQLLSLCQSVLAWHARGSADSKTTILNTFGLAPCDVRQWREKGEQRRNQEFTAQGWSLLSNQEMDDAWEQFLQKFNFRLGTTPARWPGIVEPSASVTWDLRTVFPLEFAKPGYIEEAELSLRSSLTRAFQACIPPGERVLALDCNHPCYFFDPHCSARDLHSWPIELLPVGNYHIFATARFDIGVFGHPWEKSLCVFGEAFVKNFKDDYLTVALRRQSDEGFPGRPLAPPEGDSSRSIR
ncbi:DUF2716 domain-containing protein [Lignipirellula cremea]|uniref:Uncharacterized protein n=1 Tax=Lignipirellula cremea TaxID=2528010 RepID=A0A518DSY0_9BACT|nr:DUF2716 domain-containing protein [Lignipirellula cremea]QDU94951.1 hypothetical protein Pla8534_27590 [Lignipirellula cremea]